MRDSKEQHGPEKDLEDQHDGAGALSGRPGGGRRTRAIGLVVAGASLIALLPPIDALGALGNRRDGASERAPAAMASPIPSPARTPERPAGPAGPAPIVAAGPALDEQRATWRVTGGTEEAAALAVLVARRTALTTTSDPFVVLEALERPSGDAVVVTVLVDDGAGPVERLAVPVALGPEGARLAGTPWALPAPDPEVLEPDTSPITDALLLDSARRALDDLGLPTTDLRLARTTSWPVVATARDSTGTTSRVWLRWHLDRYVVAGLPLDRTSVVDDVDAVDGTRP